ncbi:MAG: hypothetical protein ACI4OY_01695, partial [Aristaeellaceae bacterium]
QLRIVINQNDFDLFHCPFFPFPLESIRTPDRLRFLPSGAILRLMHVYYSKSLGSWVDSAITAQYSTQLSSKVSQMSRHFDTIYTLLSFSRMHDP